MRKINNIISFIFLFTIFGCKMNISQTDVAKLNHFAIIEYNPNEKFPKFESAQATNLTYEEIKKLEFIIMPKIQKNLKKHKYFRQYIAAINSSGEKFVWINFFCIEYYEASHETFIMEAADGGDCFFEVKVNLTKKDCYFYKENMEG